MHSMTICSRYTLMLQILQLQLKGYVNSIGILIYAQYGHNIDDYVHTCTFEPAEIPYGHILHSKSEFGRGWSNFVVRVGQFELQGI